MEKTEISPVCFTTNKKDLENAIKKVKHGVAKKSVLPILGSYLFEATDDKVTIRATDLEIQIEVEIDNIVMSSDYRHYEESSFVVDAKTFEKILKTLPKDEEIELHYCNEEEDVWNLGIFAKNTSLHISTLDAEEFPCKIELEKVDFQTEVNSNDLIKALTKVFPALSKDETRPALNGVLFTYKDFHLNFVATDSFRLAQDQIETFKDNINTDKEIKVIVPRETISKLLKITPKNSTVEISIELLEKDNFARIVLIVDNTRIVSRLIDAEFPKYEQLLPEFYYLDIITDKEALLKAVERAKVILEKPSNSYYQSSDSSNSVIIETGDQLIVTSKQDDNIITEEVEAIIEVNSKLESHIQKEQENLAKLEKEHIAVGKYATEEERAGKEVGLEIAMKTSENKIVAMEAIQSKNIRIGFNPDFLIDGLKAIEGEEVRIQLMSPLNPALIVEKDNSYSYLLMPVRLEV